jgi:hypothetical protein
MSKSVLHAVSTREPYITPRATGPRGDIDRGLIRYVIQILTSNVCDMWNGRTDSQTLVYHNTFCLKDGRIKMINFKGEVTLFRLKYSEYLNTCIIKGMVEIYDIMNIRCQNLYRPSGRWPLGWYMVFGLIRHVIQILTCFESYIVVFVCVQ